MPRIVPTKGNLQATTDYSPEKDELEFYFSEQDKPNDETVFALQQSSDDSDSDQYQVIFQQQLLSLDTTVPIPCIKLHILPSKFQRPIPAISLVDTGEGVPTCCYWNSPYNSSCWQCLINLLPKLQPSNNP